MTSDQHDPRPGLREAATCANCERGRPSVFYHFETYFCGAYSESGLPLHQYANQVCDLHTPREREEVQR